MADFDLIQSGQEIQDILDGAAMQTDLTAETERAEQAEQQLQNNIDLEETRAKAAEQQNADDIDVIEGKIPAAASSENKLADKAFVSSSIATATATYRGAYNLVSDLHLTIDATEQQIAAALAGAISTADNNDYCFVQIPTADATPTQIAAIERYKFNGTAWAYEYTLNNSGFTADQWAALNSGITTGLVAKLAALPNNDELTLLLGSKQDVLTFDNVPTEGSNNPVKSGGVKSAIDSEKERAQGAEQANAGNIAQVVAMIPAAASSENQLADKNFVNSSIATNTATYRGAYNEVSDLSLTVDATHEQIAAALAGSISTADNNDYCFVQIPTADATPTQIAAIERYKFNGTAWAYEYTLNNSGFTADQWAAINSGITSGLVAKLAALPTNDDLVAALAGKQPMLTFDNVPTESSNNPVKSGGVYAAIAEEAGTRAAAIAAIVALIPSAASALNQLADKAFVNSSISTATAVFKGTFNVVADLELNYNASQAQIALMLGSKIASADNNDYCFVQIPTSNETPLEIARTDRYKYNGTAWAYEYTLNNSGFTAAQWAAINSGITSLLKDKLIDLPTATELATQLAAKQNALTFDTTPTEGSSNPVTSDGIHAAIDTEAARALAAEQGLQDDYDELYALYQTLEGGSIIPVAAADWPVSNPQQNVIYRVANSATPTAYSDYMYNGTTTLLLPTFTFPGIDSEPTPDSTNLVTSGGTFDAIMQNGPAFDLSAYNAAGGTLATYADLSAALTALNALPAAYKKGGMSMKFVLSSDNKYYQFRCKTKDFSANPENWAIDSDAVYVNNPEFIAVYTDKNGRLIVAIENDGNVIFGYGVPKQIENKISKLNGDVNAIKAFLDGFTDSTLLEYLNMTYGKYIENPEFVSVFTDKNKRILFAIENDGNFLFGAGVPLQIIEYVRNAIKIGDKSVLEYLKSTYGEYIENPEFMAVFTDKNKRIICAIKNNGDIFFGFGVPTQIQEYVESYINEDKNTIRAYLDKVFGKYIEDPENRIEINVDKNKKILSYRDVAGVLHEVAGLWIDNLQLGSNAENNIKELGVKGSNVAEIQRATKYNLPNYGAVDIVQETFYLKKDNRVSTYNDVYVILDYEDTDANAAAKLTIGYWYIKSTLTDNGDGTYSKNENSVKLDYYASSKVTSLNGSFYVTSTLTEIVDPVTGNISYEVNENSVEVTEIVGTPDVRTWPVDKKTEHKCVVDINFGHYLSGTFYIGVKFQGSSTLNYRERNFRFTFYKNSSYAKKDKVKIGELLRLSGFNLKANWTDPTKLREIILYRFILAVQGNRDLYNQYPWEKDNPYCGATGTINGFPVRVSIGGAFYGIDIFGLKKDEKNYMLDKAKLVDGNVVEGSGIFASGTGGPYVDGYFRNSWSVHPEYWEDEMNDEDVLTTNGHTPADSAALTDFLTFINSDNFDKEHVPTKMNVVSWIDYFILMQVFVMYDNTSRNVVLYSDNSRTKFYVYFYDLDLAWNVGHSRVQYDADILADGTSFSKDMTPWDKLWDVYKDEIINRYSELRKTVLTVDYLNTIYQEILKYIPTADIQSQKARWGRGVATSDMSPYMEWLEERLNWLDENYFNV